VFFDHDIKADLLPDRTICLTYDDGPGESEGDGAGPRSRELGRFLHGEGVSAAFFVIGRHVERHPETVRALHAWGHLVGNHTYSHPGLVALAEAGGDVVGEVERTTALLRALAPDRAVYLRAPYGNWRQTIQAAQGTVEDRPDSIVAAALNASGRLPDHVGPVNWDITAEDWNCWRFGLSPAECARRYLDEIERVGRGMVLMHDSSDEDGVRPHNQALPMTRLLVHALRQRGYRFVRLDEIPQVRSAARVRAQVILSSPDGGTLTLENRRSGMIRVAPPREPGVWEPFGVVPLGEGRIALRARNGMFLAVPNGSRGPVTASSPDIGALETLSMESGGARGIVLRTSSGAFLVVNDEGAGLRLAVSTRPGDRIPFLTESVWISPTVETA
jgi:peptidoglycan/xylan/chitin deacetylase (PgdA/CDA1 family)